MLLKASFLLALLPLLPAPAAAIPPPSPKGGEIRVSLLENVTHYNPQVAVFRDGGFVVVWNVGPSDFQGRFVIHARFFTEDGTPAGGELRLVDRSGYSQSVDQIVADRDGSFLVVWTERESADGKSSVFVRRFNRDGTPRGQRIQANVSHKSSRYDGVLAVGVDGRFAVAWSADVDLKPFYRSYANSVARIFNAQGTPLTKEFIVGVGYPGIGDDNTYSEPAALGLGPDGSLTVQLQDLNLPDTYDNYLNRYDRKGKPKKHYALSEPLFCCVDTPGASLGMGKDGNLVAAWNGEWSVIMAQRFAANGDPRGAKFRVSTEEDFIQEDPCVAIASGGTSVIVWMEKERDGDGGGIFGRAFSADGTPLSNDFQINTTSAGWQYQPAVATAPGGPVVVVWVSYSSGAVFARLLTSGP
jgi:hypothetical protein